MEYSLLVSNDGGWGRIYRRGAVRARGGLGCQGSRSKPRRLFPDCESIEIGKDRAVSSSEKSI